MWFGRRTLVPEPFVSFSYSSLQINSRWLWERDMGNEDFSNFFITPVIWLCACVKSQLNRRPVKIGSFTATRVAIQTKNFPFSSLLCNSTTTVHRMFRRLEAAVESSDRCFFVFVLPTFRSCAKKKNESEKLIKNIDRAIV